VAHPRASARLAALALGASFYDFDFASFDYFDLSAMHFPRAALALRLAHFRAHAGQNVLAMTSGLAALLVLLARLLGTAFDYFDLAALDALDDLATMHFPRL